MNLDELKQLHIRESIGVSAEDFPHTLAFVDFANVNKWYERDEHDADGALLPATERLVINLQGLKDFLSATSDSARLYYGTDPENPGSGKFMGAARYIFGDRQVFTKPVQKIRHYIDIAKMDGQTRLVRADKFGKYVIIPKSNFDVEITLDAVRLSPKYETFCLLSGDADFAPLLRYVKKLGKRIILIKGGFIQDNLRRFADVVVNAQDIKRYIAMKKQKPDHEGPVLADSRPVSTGRTETDSVDPVYHGDRSPSSNGG